MNRAEFEREVAPGFREVMERLRLDPFRFLFDPEHFGNAIDEYADESIRVRAVLDRSFVTIESSEPVRQRWMTMSAWQAFLDRSSRMTELSLDAQLDFLLRNFQIIVEAYKAENLAGHVGAVEEWSQLLRFD